MDNDKTGNHNQKKINLSTTSKVTTPNKGSRVMKMLSENKLKRLNILTFINEKKEILFTKKAYKTEKEKIWSQIFEMMRDSGMVSPEKDWRYVRDVSFSNWRKRAQKRLKHLSANGFRLNMDECEFLISDILGQTPVRPTIKERMANNAKHSKLPNPSVNIEENEEEDEDEESDEYMIDSDDDYSMFNEMLFIPKVVINDIDGKCSDLEDDPTTTTTNTSANSMNNNTTIRSSKNPILLNSLTRPSATETVVDGRNKSTNNSKTNGMMTISPTINGKKAVGGSKAFNHSGIMPGNDQRLIDLEIENKILKNRYMKLKIFKLEKNLGFDHCAQVKDLKTLPH